MKTKLYLIQSFFIFSITFLTIIILTRLIGFNNTPIIAGLSGGIGVLLSPRVYTKEMEKEKQHKLVWFKKELPL